MRSHMRGDYHQNYKFSYAVLTWCFRLLKCCYALLIWHCEVQCRTFIVNYVFLNSIVFFYIVLCFSLLDYVLPYCIIHFCHVMSCIRDVSISIRNSDTESQRALACEQAPKWGLGRRQKSSTTPRFARPARRFFFSPYTPLRGLFTS